MIPINLIDANLEDVSEEKVARVKGSIEDIGVLLHPITVRAEDGRYKLRAGRARLKAFIELGRSEIPAIIDNGNSNDVIIAIHENLKRENLPWWEAVDLELKLHELRQSEHGKRDRGRGAPEKGGWSQKDTAKELGIALGAMSQDLSLANALRRNPHLAKIQDKMTAVKLVKEAARREQIEAETLMPVDFEMDQVFCGDSLEVLKEIPSFTFNVCITDPPWSEYKDETLIADESTLLVFKEIYRTLAHDALLYAFVSTPDWYLYKKELPRFGFSVQDYPLIWNKKGVMTHGRKYWEYARDYEPILLAAKGVPTLSVGTQITSTFNFTPVHSTKLVHPNEKPVDLLKEIIRHSTFDEARILDPFAGSGATLLACKEMNRHYIGIERNYHFYEKILKRLERRQ